MDSNLTDLIFRYHKEIKHYNNYIDGTWGCEASRLEGMKAAVKVLESVVIDLERLLFQSNEIKEENK